MHYIKHILYYRQRFDLMQLWELLPQSLMLDSKSTEWQSGREDGYKLEGTNVKLVFTAQPRFHHISVPVASGLNGEGGDLTLHRGAKYTLAQNGSRRPQGCLGPMSSQISNNVCQLQMAATL